MYKKDEKCCYQDEFASVFENRLLIKLCCLVEHIFVKLILKLNKITVRLSSILLFFPKVHKQHAGKDQS